MSRWNGAAEVAFTASAHRDGSPIDEGHHCRLVRERIDGAWRLYFMMMSKSGYIGRMRPNNHLSAQRAETLSADERMREASGNIKAWARHAIRRMADLNIAIICRRFYVKHEGNHRIERDIKRAVLGSAA